MAHRTASHSLPVFLTGMVLLLAACAGKSATAAAAHTTRPAAVLAAAAQAPSATAASASRTVTVDATGKTQAVPDQLVARLGVHTSGPTAAGVLSDANARAQAVLDQLKQQGVDPKDVQTTQVGLGPTFDKHGNITGFAADNDIQITLRRLAIAGRQLDAVVRTPGDAARLESVTLGFNNDDKLLAAARTDGVHRARSQAQQMVGALGADLGAVRTITESAPDAGRFASASSGALSADSAAVPIAPGTQDLTVSVHVVFEIR